MADPATIAMAVKAAVALATDKRTWKAVGVVIASILTPIILMVVMIASILSAGSDHNKAAIDLSFNGGSIPAAMPAEYASHISDMSECLAVLDGAVSEVEARMEGGMLDNIRIKSLFYSLNFGAENLSLSGAEARAFVDCFVTYEERTQTVDGVEATYTVAVPVSLETAYERLMQSGMTVTNEVKANTSKIYERLAFGGAELFTGEIERGGTGSTVLDISSFTDPSTKNNLDLAAYAEQAFDSGWGYVWGTYGDILTDSLFDYKLEQYPDGVGNYKEFIRSNWLGGRTTDCVGLIKGYGWLDPDTMAIDYGTNGMPDIGADSMYRNAAVSGSMNTMPDIPGLAVWKPGHIGIYVGNGKVIEAMGTKYGVVKTKLADRSWSAWLEIPYINYNIGE
ncbi:hypothetical protein [Desulfoscipio gibsoniae]|uniref:Cell wall-associated hydrolase, invasion-associated protein n=1 Tax=Desulfoscipio gibsoniae DSM 7213 TaxID=767817 RepID=R4KI38_9FIRM|nr:hypothetical protein [Desulfoscipio gibsoniae]AGL02873.1 hypothetical protein Desgi_3550 [Desulfoscipio gibsoniae DSM 7213]